MDIKELEKIEHLCNIKVKEENREKLSSHINDIINNIKRMYEIDIEGINMYRPAKIYINSLREDSPSLFDDIDDILNNAANREGDFIVVPKIIGGGK